MNLRPNFWEDSRCPLFIDGSPQYRRAGCFPSFGVHLSLHGAPSHPQAVLGSEHVGRSWFIWSTFSTYCGFSFFLSLETNQESFKNAFACGSWLSREHHIISKLFFNVPFVHSCLVKEMFYMSCLCSEKLPWVVLRIVCFLPDVVRWNGLLSQLMYVPYLQS